MRPPGAAALVLLLAIGCSGGDPTVEAAVTSAAPTAATSTTTTSTTAPTTTSTSTTTPGPVCIADDLAGPTGPLTFGFDIDGLPGDDAATTFLADDGWHLQARFGDGGAADEVLPTAPTDLARVAGASDLDGDGTVELLVQVGTGAATTIVGLFDLDGCDLEPVLLDGLPAELAVGGTVLQQQGLACGESDLTVRTATSTDGATYATLDTTYDLDDGTLVPVGEEADERLVDDPAMEGYADLAC